jgi:hypothetical protein
LIGVYNYILQRNRSRYYVLIGDEDTWKISLANNLWGFSDKSIGNWNRCNIGDYLAFYVTAPTKKIIGFGTIKNKFVDENIVWVDEKLFGRAIWKHKFQFEKISVINDWSQGIPIQEKIVLNVGLKLIDKILFLSLVKQAELKWKKGLDKRIFTTY